MTKTKKEPLQLPISLFSHFFTCGLFMDLFKTFFVDACILFMVCFIVLPMNTFLEQPGEAWMRQTSLAGE